MARRPDFSGSSVSRKNGNTFQSGRPIKRRSSEDYRQTVAALSRLRTALALDTDADAKEIERATAACDALVKALVPFTREAA